MTTKVATLTTHPTEPDIAILRTPLGDTGDIMRGFEPATYSAHSRGYLTPIALLDQLRSYLRSKGIHLVDERTNDQPKPRTTGQWCPQHGAQPCPPGVTLDDWAQRHPEEAAQLRAGLEKIKARSRDLRTKR